MNIQTLNISEAEVEQDAINSSIESILQIEPEQTVIEGLIDPPETEGGPFKYVVVKKEPFVIVFMNSEGNTETEYIWNFSVNTENGEIEGRMSRKDQIEESFQTRKIREKEAKKILGWLAGEKKSEKKRAA